MGIIDLLRLPESKGIKDLNDPSVPYIHGRIIRKKPFLKRLYLDFYRELRSLVPGDPADKVIVELGSGGGFIKEVIPNAITSDVNIAAPLDVKFSANGIPFRDNSVDVFLMLNVFHHITDPVACIGGMNRCLKKGGRIVMIEPANTIYRRFVDTNFHHEKFDANGGWMIRGDGPLTCSNEALSWIIFCRDRALFENKFPGLKIKSVTIRNNFRYIISGGLTYRQLLPSCMYYVVKGVEKVLSPMRKYTGYFQTIELMKMGGMHG